MIKDVINENGILTWVNSRKETVKKEYNEASYITDFETIVVLYDNDSIAVALNENGEEICNISNSDEVYLMYLLDHYMYKLCVAASVKEKDVWRDVYLRFNGKEFVIASNAR